MIRASWFSYAFGGLIVLASLLIFWQVNAGRRHTLAPELNTDQHDSYVIGARYHSTDRHGQLHERLHVQSAKHYPYHNTAKLVHPELDVYGPQGDSWHIHATQGTSTQGGDTLILEDNVHIEHRTDKNAPAIIVKTDKLVVHPNQGTAESDALVTITYPQIVLRGKGLQGDMKAGTLKLLTQIRGQYEPIIRPDLPALSAQPVTELRTAL